MAMCTDDDVTAWLGRLSLVQYAEKFHTAGYSSLQQCLPLSKADLSSIGVTKPSHVCQLFGDLQKLKADGELERSCSQPRLLSPLNVSLTHQTSVPSLCNKTSKLPSHHKPPSENAKSDIPVEAFKEEKLSFHKDPMRPPLPVKELSDEKSLKISSPAISQSAVPLDSPFYENNEIRAPPIPPRPSKISTVQKADDSDSSLPPLPERKIVVPPLPETKIVIPPLSERKIVVPPLPDRKIIVLPPPPCPSSSDTEHEEVNLGESASIHSDNNLNDISVPTQQTKENHSTIETFIASEKEQVIVEKSVKVKYSFLVVKLRSEIHRIAQNSEIQKIELVTDPHCAINIKGTEVSVKQAESEISSFIKDSITVFCYQVLNPLARPILRSPEILQLCKKLHSELAVSLSIQLQPKLLSSALDESGVLVQICEGDITLDSCDIFMNFTDENLTLSDDVHAMLDEVEIKRYEDHVKHNTPQLCGTAVCFGRRNKVIIHAILPKWVDGNSGEGPMITYAVMHSLTIAAYHKAISISLPFLSSVDEGIPLDLLAESCLSAVHKFIRHCDQIHMIRLVLPVTMAKKFQDKFTSGVFKQSVMTDKLNTTGVDRFCNLGQPGDSAWLWEDDNGEYNYYQPEDNKLLNKTICSAPFCILNIGYNTYRVDYSDMTQINTYTMKKRKVVRLPLGSVWQFRKSVGKWEQFSPQVTLMLEALFLTGTDYNITIDDHTHSYDFKHMTQWNINTDTTTSIRRIDSKDDVCNATKSTVMISGLAPDVYRAEEMLQQCIKSLITVQFVDIQRKHILTFEKNVKHIQNNYNVKIIKASDVITPSDIMVKYKIEGHSECIQKAIIELYKTMATIQKPIEWEPQSESIELKDILKGSPEWSKICARMQMTLDCNVISVKRIQNEFLWEKYVQHKELMSHKGPRSMTEMELFHGTRSNPPKCIYESEEGFDMRYSREGLWGLGNYFAENAKYASSYAYNCGYSKTFLDVLQLFLVKVLIGDSCNIPQDKMLRMPPFKANRKAHFDTVNGHTHGSRVYITYSNDKAYPVYLISYTIQPWEQ